MNGSSVSERLTAPAMPIATAPPSPAAARSHSVRSDRRVRDSGLLPQARELFQRVARVEVGDAAREKPAGLPPLRRGQASDRRQANPCVGAPERAKWRRPGHAELERGDTAAGAHDA